MALSTPASEYTSSMTRSTASGSGSPVTGSTKARVRFMLAISRALRQMNGTTRWTCFCHVFGYSLALWRRLSSMLRCRYSHRMRILSRQTCEPGPSVRYRHPPFS